MQERDGYAVTRNRRAVQNGLDYDEAHDLIGREFAKGDRCALLEEDGYETDITRSFKISRRSRNNPLTPRAARSTMTDMTTITIISGKPSGFAVDGVWQRTSLNAAYQPTHEGRER